MPRESNRGSSRFFPDRDNVERFLVEIELFGDYLKETDNTGVYNRSQKLEGHIRNLKHLGVPDEKIVEYIGYMTTRLRRLPYDTNSIMDNVVRGLSETVNKPFDGAFSDEFIEKMQRAVNSVSHSPLKTDAYRRVVASFADRHPDVVRSDFRYGDRKLAIDTYKNKAFLWMKGIGKSLGILKVLGPIGFVGAGIEAVGLEGSAHAAFTKGDLSKEAFIAYQGILTGHTTQATVDPSLVAGELPVQAAYQKWAKAYGIDENSPEYELYRPGALTDMFELHSTYDLTVEQLLRTSPEGIEALQVGLIAKHLPETITWQGNDIPTLEALRNTEIMAAISISNSTDMKPEALIQFRTFENARLAVLDIEKLNTALVADSNEVNQPGSALQDTGIKITR